jgi:hypothetical protein
VIDCAWFRDKAWWPRIEQMKQQSGRVFDFLQYMQPRGAIADSLGWEWNDCDGVAYSRGDTGVKLVHFTTITDGQPYRPYPSVNYPTKFPFCRNPAIGELWWDTYREALATEFGPAKAVRMVQEAIAPKTK